MAWEQLLQASLPHDNLRCQFWPVVTDGEEAFQQPGPPQKNNKKQQHTNKQQQPAALAAFTQKTGVFVWEINMKICFS